MILTELLYIVGGAFLYNLFADPVVDSPQARDDGTQQRSRANPTHVLNPLYGNWNTFGQDIYLGANSDNSIGYYAIALGIVPEGATVTVSEVIADDIVLTLDSDGNVTAGTDPNGNAVDKYNGLIRIITYPAGGRSTFLEGAASDWDSSFIGDRIVYAAVQLDRDREAGVVQLPELRFVGTSSVNNPADIVEDMLTDPRYGLAKDMSLIGDTFAEHRTYCAQEVAHLNTAGDTVMAPRFTASGAIDTTVDVVTRCNQVLAHQNASLGFYDGQYQIFANKVYPTTGVLSIDEDWFVGGINFIENTSALFTQLRVQFRDNAANQYRENSVYLDVPQGLQDTRPGLQSRIDTVQLPYCDDEVQARRVGAWVTNEAFTSLVIEATVDMRGIQLEPQQIVTITSEKYSFTNKLFQVKEVQEAQQGSRLTYRVTFREYAAANYADDGTIAEQDPAPNIDFVDPSVIAAVTDLVVTNINASASVPNFSLQWTVPSSFIDRFDIFFGTNNIFSDSEFLRTVNATGSAFSSGSMITEIITGVPAGSYFLWVVGRNDFGSSAESNTATLANWEPDVILVDTAQGIRHHDNPVTMDPGAPMGADGVLTGWYDPVEGSTLTTNRPTDPDPHWEARGRGTVVGGLNEITDFVVSGTAGAQTTTTIPTNQQHTATVSGTAGNVQNLPAQQEITEFTFSGQAATAVGRQEYWGLDFTGSSDGTAAGVTEEFFIYLTGESHGTDADIGNYTVSSTFASGNVGWFGGSATSPVSSTQIRIGIPDTATAQLIADAAGATLPTSQSASGAQFTIATPFSITFSGVSGSTTSFTQTFGPVMGATSEVTFNNNFYFFNIPVQSTTGTNTNTSNNQQLQLSLEAQESSVQISIPTESINQTFTLPSGLTTATALRNNLLTQLQASTAITAEFTVASATADAQTTGVTAGEPIITLTANDDTDHSIAVTFSNGTGDLTGSAFGSHVEGSPADIPTEIRVTYDSGLTPSFQDIVIGEAADGPAIAGVVATMIDGHGQLEATRGSFSFDELPSSTKGPNVRFYDVSSDAVPTADSGVTIVSSSATSIPPRSGGDFLWEFRLDFSNTADRDSYLSWFNSNSFTSVRVDSPDFIAGTVSLATQTGDTDSLYMTVTQSYAQNDSGSSFIQRPGNNDAIPNFGPISTFFFSTDIRDLVPEFENVTGLSQPQKWELVNPLPPNSGGFIGYEILLDSNTVQDGPFSAATSFEGTTRLRIRSRNAGIGNIDQTTDRQDTAEEFVSVFTNDVDTIALGNPINEQKALFRVSETTIHEHSGEYYISVEPVFSDIPTFLPSFSLYRTPDDWTDEFFTTWIGPARRFVTTETTTTVTPDATSSRVVVNTTQDANFNEPVLSIRQRGTSSSFTQAVSTLLEGQAAADGTKTSYTVTLAGTQVAQGEFFSSANAAVAADQMQRVINGLSTHTATLFGDVVTATSVDNSGDDLLVIVGQGTNDTGGTSTNNLAVSRAVTQVGRDTAGSVGMEGLITVLEGGVSIGTVNPTGMTTAQIAQALSDVVNADTSWLAFAPIGSSFSYTATFTGPTPTITYQVVPGVIGNADGTTSAANLQVTIATANSGTRTETTGTLTQLSATVGTTTHTIDVPSGSNVIQTAMALMTLIGMFSEYVAAIQEDMATVRATSAQLRNEEDITVTVSRQGTGGTTAVARTQVQDGALPTIDFSDTEWTYYVINQEVRVDDDTTAMMPNNAITIPTGLVVDSENIFASTTSGTATATMTFTTKAHRSNLLITGGISEAVLITNTGTTTHSHTLEYSTDGGTNWTSFFVTQAFNPNLGGTANGQIFNNVQFIGAQIDEVPANSTVMFRARDTGTAATGAYGFGFLVIEERNVAM